MFLTDSYLRTQFSSGLRGGCESDWEGVELALSANWFFVTFPQLILDRCGGVGYLKRNLLLSKLTLIDRVVGMTQEGDLHLESIQLLSPARINKSGDWKMERLACVWLADEPNALGRSAEIYETVSGEVYVNSRLKTPLERLGARSLLFDF